MKHSSMRFLPRTALAILSCLAFLMPMVAACSAPESPPSPLKQIPMQQVLVEGIKVSYLEEGQGMPLVLVHGIPTSSFLWRNMIAELATHGRVIALDLPGFGFSDPPPNADYTISNYARILASFLEALAIDRATLICHDLGGPIVLTYALRHPDRYRQLIILDTFLHNDLPPWPLSMKIAKIWPMGELFMGLGGEKIARSGLEEGVIDKSRITEEIVRRYYKPDGNPDKLNQSMLGTLRVDYREDLEFIEKNLWKIEKPTLILWGDNDRFLPFSLGERIHKDIKGSQLKRISACGHFIPEDQPELATQIIVGFMTAQAR